MTMAARHLSVKAVYKAAGFEPTAMFPYSWVHELNRIVKSLRLKYTNENTFCNHWINFLQFVKVVAPELVEPYAEAFKALEEQKNAPVRFIGMGKDWENR